MAKRKSKAKSPVPVVDKEAAAKKRAAARVAREDLKEAKQKAAACKRAVAAAQKESIDGFPNLAAASKKYREAVSAHIKCLKAVESAVSRMEKIMA